MSLRDFVKRPRISEAFDRYAVKLKTPKELGSLPIRVLDSGGPRGLAGTAFDYLVRIQIERQFRGADIAIHRWPWISETVRQRFDLDLLDEGHLVVSDGYYWRRYLDDAHEAARAYIAGEGCLKCLSLLVQYMAQADLLVRNAFAFDYRFDASDRLARELRELLDAFHPMEMLVPARMIVLNPTFALSAKVGGADADLLIDDLLIDIKTVDRILLRKSYLAQLAGYAVLHDLGGTHIPGGVHLGPLVRLGIYFARHGKLVELGISEVFPDDGYARFREVFKAELDTWKAAGSKRSLD